MARLSVLVIDVGGTKIKVGGTGRKALIRIPSGPHFTAEQMATEVKEAIGDWAYDVVSIGFPGPVTNDEIHEEPVNLGKGWAGFDFAKAFGKPVRITNDAAMQALGSYVSGKMLFLGLGTGLGSALVIDGIVAQLELAHLPYRKGGSYEDYVGLRGLRRFGKKSWRKHVARIVTMLKRAMQVEQVVLGGGQAKLLKKVPEGATMGNNTHAIEGGIRMWAEKIR